VAEALGGVAPGMRFVTGTGGETIPAGVDPKSVIVERSVPISRCWTTAMLAWEMNGEPVPHAHGGPLRLIVPGYSGVNSVKYVKRLAFTRDQTDASDPEPSVSPRAARCQGEPEPAARLGDGCEVVGQLAVAGELDRPARLGADTRRCDRRHERSAARRGLARRRQDRGATRRSTGRTWDRYAWRQFVLQTQLRPGKHMITSRATDTQGNVQEETTPFNSSGYLNAGWRAHMVEITVA
jgi:DMSO/TMAO reductase YedYZ molybdopterin-dependent catalytic subunit